MRTKGGDYHHGDLRRALLDAVIELAAERGSTADITLREAARCTGVSHSAPYRHFEDKGVLLATIGAEGFATLAAALRAARTGVVDDEERFVRSGIAYLEFAREHRGYLTVMFGPEIAKSRTPALQEAANDAFQVLKEFAADVGVTDVRRARKIGSVVWSFVHGVAVLHGQGQVPPSVGATAEGLAELGLRALYRSFRSSTTCRR
jgi:AcrR family transcriptional regulator